MPRHIHSRVVLKKPRVSFKDLSSQNVVGLAYDILHKIELEKNQSDKQIFCTLLHEIGHLMLPQLSEKQIIKLEKIYGETLWKIVLRLKKKWLKGLDKK